MIVEIGKCGYIIIVGAVKTAPTSDLADVYFGVIGKNCADGTFCRI